MKAIVTGHSKGLGQAIAAELLGRGIAVLGLARSGSAALAPQLAHAFQQHRIDLADSAALAAYLEQGALTRFVDGCGDVLLINNAGVVDPAGSLGQQEVSAIARAVALNVAAPLMLAAALVQASPGARRRILHVSSGAGRAPYPGWSVYCASKAALDQHARAVALDQPADGSVRICSLAPGVIDTDMQHSIRATPLARFPLRARFVALKDEGQLSSPEECAAQLVDYLLGMRFGEVAVDDLRTAR